MVVRIIPFSFLHCFQNQCMLLLKAFLICNGTGLELFNHIIMTFQAPEEEAF